MKAGLYCGALAAFVSVTSSVSQAFIITTINVTDSARVFNDSRDDPANLLGPEITEVDPGDVTTWTHESSNWNSGIDGGWFSGETSNPFVDFDLGGTYTVSEAHIWNWNGRTDTNDWNAIGVTLIFSEDAFFGNADDSSQTITLSQASGQSTYTGEHFTLTQVPNVTKIRLEVTSSGPSTITGLSEVRFSAIPEPSGAIVFGLAGLALLGCRRSA